MAPVSVSYQDMGKAVFQGHLSLAKATNGGWCTEAILPYHLSPAVRAASLFYTSSEQTNVSARTFFEADSPGVDFQAEQEREGAILAGAPAAAEELVVEEVAVED